MKLSRDKWQHENHMAEEHRETPSRLLIIRILATEKQIIIHIMENGLSSSAENILRVHHGPQDGLYMLLYTFLGDRHIFRHQVASGDIEW